MPRTAVIALSRGGASMARRLSAALGTDAVLFLDRRFADEANSFSTPVSEVFDLPLRPLFERAWDEFASVVIFLPLGATVRLVSPLLRDKRTDPALVCVDDAGRYAVSVVSGHLGGADDLAARVAKVLGAEPVITSGSHAAGTLAVDLLGQEFGWTIEASSDTVTRASAAVINGEPVAVYQEAGEREWWPTERPLPDNITLYDSLDSLSRSSCSAALIISDRTNPYLDLGTSIHEALSDSYIVLYRPPTLVAGMGCRRGVPCEELEHLLRDTFLANNLSLSSLTCIATAELKRDEPGLRHLAAKFGANFTCYDNATLNDLYTQQPLQLLNESEGASGCSTSPSGKSSEEEGLVLNRSANARRLVGVWGVAEPSALVASGASRLVVAKQIAARATLAVARIENPDPKIKSA